MTSLSVTVQYSAFPNSLVSLQNSPWPIVCHLICIGLACLAISRGVSSIEPVNRIIVPTLLLIVVFTFYWALFMPYGGMGIIHMFSPSWSEFDLLYNLCIFYFQNLLVMLTCGEMH